MAAGMIIVLATAALISVNAGEVQNKSDTVVRLNTKVSTNDVQMAIRKLGQKLDVLGARMGKLEKRVHMLHPSTTTRKPTTTTRSPTTRTRRPTTTPVQWVFYPPGTAQHRAKRYYSEYNLKFVGYGFSPISPTYIDEKGVSWEHCLRKCVENRRVHDDTWNDVQYRYQDNVNWCFCGKGSKGHREGEMGDLHYYFQ